MSFVEFVGLVVVGVFGGELVSLSLVVVSRAFVFEFQLEFFGQSRAM